jgi:amino acid adenylation domain-containing protein
VSGVSERNIEAIFPLTPMQEGILFHSLITPGSGMYFEQYSCKIHGHLDVSLFQSAWGQIVHRHPALRTLVTWKNRKQPLQIVRSQVEIRWIIDDWREIPADELEAKLTSFLDSDRTQGFEISKPPLMRLALFQLDENSYQFVWSFHHIMLDGWSMRVVLKEVFQNYENSIRGDTPKLDVVQPFQAYVRWLQQQDLEKAEAYWKAQMKGFSAPTSLGLSSQYTDLLASGNHFSEKELVLTSKLTEALSEFARGHRITLNTLIQGAWALLLGHYSQETDVAFGVTISGRPIDISGVDQMVGMFINTLPLRVQVDFDKQLIPWLKVIQLKMMENQTYEFSPLVDIQKWSDVIPGTPLFHSILVFENHPANLDHPDSGASLKSSDSRYIEYSNYPLALLVVPGEQMRIFAVYDQAWFDGETISRLLSHIEHLLGQMTLKQNTQLSELSILGEAERKQLLHQWNETDAPYPKDICIHTLIEKQAQETPSSPAVVFEDRTLTYGALDQAANVLAKRLNDLGVRSETLVGIYLESSPELLIAILGILKAGGAYVPLDPLYPDERLKFILQDSKCPVIIVHNDLTDQLPQFLRGGYEGSVVMIDDLNTTSAEKTVLELPVKKSNNLAYVIYTSGSTGKPKGVMVTHRNLVHSTTARINFYPNKTESFLLLSSFAFDSSLAGIFGTLCQGGKLVLPRQRQVQDASSLVSLITKHQVTHMLTLPSLYMVLLDLFSHKQLKSLRNIIVAGEACPPELAEHHFKMVPDARLYNEYGPTEATVWCTVHELARDDMHTSVPIGKPIANTKIYILDQYGYPCPIGIAGELHVGGEGVARGYLNQPNLTAQRFIPNPFITNLQPETMTLKSGSRIYKTGDLARWRSDGEIEFLGRIDNQIKIRGYRVELGEIEKVLLSHPKIREAAVIARQEKTIDQQDTLSNDSQDQYLEKISHESPLLVSKLLDEIDKLSNSEINLLLGGDGSVVERQ